MTNNDPLLFFHMVNCSIAGIIAVMILLMVYLFYDHLKFLQRLGLALVSSGCIMWIPIFFMWPTITPLNGWATTVLMLGITFYIGETLHRLFKHHWPNMQQVWYMKRDLERRRKERGQ